MSDDRRPQGRIAGGTVQRSDGLRMESRSASADDGPHATSSLAQGDSEQPPDLPRVVLEHATSNVGDHEDVSFAPGHRREKRDELGGHNLLVGGAAPRVNGRVSDEAVAVRHRDADDPCKPHWLWQLCVASRGPVPQELHAPAEHDALLWDVKRAQLGICHALSARPLDGNLERRQQRRLSAEGLLEGMPPTGEEAAAGVVRARGVDDRDAVPVP
mmetsp:Transcript_7109/g.20187  ORF Transcript_7109/g.20187 Transcript_7109/m.20187 type:complete len:215 (+) Transcript_7109:330-974(+)